MTSDLTRRRYGDHATVLATLALGLWSAAGCVQQDRGLVVEAQVAIGALPTEPIPTLAGAMPLTDARLRVRQLVLEPCPALTARSPLSWLLGGAVGMGRAEHAEGARVIDLDTELTAGETISVAVPMPPNHPLCAVELRFAASRSADLTVVVDGSPRRWAPPVPDARWAITPLSLDRVRRSATVRIATQPARWLAPFGPDGMGDRDAPLSEQLAGGVTRSLTIDVR